MTGGQYIYCGRRRALASHVGGPWWRCGFCGQLVQAGDDVSGQYIVPPGEAPLVLVLVCALLSPFLLVVWLAFFVPYVAWVNAGVLLSVVTGRNWCLAFGELPRLRGAR